MAMDSHGIISCYRVCHVGYRGLASMSDIQKLKCIYNLNVLECNDIKCAFINNIYKEIF